MSTETPTPTPRKQEALLRQHFRSEHEINERMMWGGFIGFTMCVVATNAMHVLGNNHTTGDIAPSDMLAIGGLGGLSVATLFGGMYGMIRAKLARDGLMKNPAIYPRKRKGS